MAALSVASIAARLRTVVAASGAVGDDLALGGEGGAVGAGDAQCFS